jgi:NADH-quinone oxidoreductase subunit E
MNVLSTSKMEKIDVILNKFPDLSRDNLIPVLQATQDEFGFLSEESLKKIATALKLPVSKVYGLSTFYNQFRFVPLGKYHIRICHGTTCHMNDAGMILNEIRKMIGIKDGETSRDGLFSLEVLSCIGACGQAPVISVNDKFFEKITKEKLKVLLQKCTNLEDI